MAFHRTLTLAGCVVLMSSGAFAQQMSDRDYCQELAHVYRAYARNDTTPAAAGPVAMSQCDMGKYADGIAQLSKLLTDRRVPVPPR
jgi:hypothetical protein